MRRGSPYDPVVAVISSMSYVIHVLHGRLDADCRWACKIPSTSIEISSECLSLFADISQPLCAHGMGSWWKWVSYLLFLRCNCYNTYNRRACKSSHIYLARNKFWSLVKVSERNELCVFICSLYRAYVYFTDWAPTLWIYQF